MAKNSKIDRFIELRVVGCSYDKIAKELKVSKPTLLAWSEKYAGLLAEAKKAHRDAFLDEVKLSAKTMARSLSDRLKLVQGKFAAVLEESEMEIGDLLDLEESLLEACAQLTKGESPSYRFSSPSKSAGSEIASSPVQSSENQSLTGPLPIPPRFEFFK